MDDMLRADNRALAVALGELIREHRGDDVVVMDLRELNSWTDFFIIATVSSSTHVKGLQRQIAEFARERGLEILRRHRKAAADEGWNLIDLGTMVVHLMTPQSRSFYELERLWGAGALIDPGA
jgi:ribosome-associated protein